MLAAGTATGQVWLWRVADRTPLCAVQGHTGAVRGMALSADGRLVASGGGRVWYGCGRPAGGPSPPCEGHRGTVRGVALNWWTPLALMT